MRWTSRIRHPRSVRPGVGLLDAAAPAIATPADDADSASVDPAHGSTAPAHEAMTLQHLSDVPVGCRVVVLGPPGALRSLPGALPPSWTVDHADEVGDLTVADLVVVTAPTPGKVAAIQARQPDASIVAIAHPAARVDAVVELLAGGATACVRTTEADLVAAHLIACARRYSVGAR
jgi:hypothetical protein